MAFSDTATVDVWRERALARSLAGARARSVDRLDRLVSAARDLANETGSAGFTVSQVAARAGASLKIFYRYFASKDDLLVALLEEDSRLGAAILRERVDEYTDRDARLGAYLTGVFELLTLPGALGYAGVLIREHRRLSENRPDELAAALAPIIDVFGDELVAGVTEGVITSADPRRDARLTFTLVLDGIHDVVVGRAEPLEQAAYLWRFVRGGPPTLSTAPPREDR
jgi:TetR/AcrR family transcriptional regulator